ncbi:MAG: hypothetical protein V3T39_07640, partial [Gammaproteobacteria bacterium]
MTRFQGSRFKIDVPATPDMENYVESLNPLDLYQVRGLLNDEEQLVQDTVGRFVDDKVIPIIGQAFEDGRFPA